MLGRLFAHWGLVALVCVAGAIGCHPHDHEPWPTNLQFMTSGERIELSYTTDAQSPVALRTVQLQFRTDNFVVCRMGSVETGQPETNYIGKLQGRTFSRLKSDLLRAGMSSFPDGKYDVRRDQFGDFLVAITLDEPSGKSFLVGYGENLILGGSAARRSVFDIARTMRDAMDEVVWTIPKESDDGATICAAVRLELPDPP